MQKKPGRSGLRTIVLMAAAAATVVASLGAAMSASAAIPVKPAHTWGTNGRVNIILPVGNQIVLGGEFTAVTDTAGDSFPANNLAVINATTGAADLTWTGNANNTVTALATDNGVLYVGGLFSKVDGEPRTRLAAISLATGAPIETWTPTADQPVDCLAVAGGFVYASGAFLNIGDTNGNHARPYVAKIDENTGMLDTAWAPVPNDRVRGLAVSTNLSEIYIAGDFKKVNNNGQVKVIAEFSTSDPAVLAPFRATATNNTAFAQVFDIATDGTAVYSAVGGSGGACTAMDPVTGARIWMKHTNGNLQSVRVANGLVYCGGHYGGATAFDGLPRQKIAVVSATAPYATTSFNPNIDSPLGVWAVGVDGNHLYLGGDFGVVQSVNQPHFAEFIDTSIQTPPTAPALTATAGDTQVELQWDPPSTDGGSTVKNYNLYRRLVPSGTYAKIATIKGGTSYDDTAVTNGTTYGYEVTAVNSLGEGPTSAEVQATPVQFILSPPSPPQSFTLSGGTGSDSLTWSAPLSNGNSVVTGYNIYRGTASGAETLLTSVPATTLAYTDTAILAGTTYYYYVTAVNAIGEGAASTELSATPVAGVPGPSVLSADVEPGVVHLTWTYPASDGGSPVTKYVLVRDGVRYQTIKAPALNYDDTAVSPGDQHTYQLRAVNAVGTGGYSNSVAVTAQ